MENEHSLNANGVPANPVFPVVQAREGDAGARGAEGCLGILMLDTRFPRPPGDIGNPASFSMPVRQLTVAGAVPRAVVASAGQLLASGVAERFAAAARELQAQGVRAITTSCGFLVLLQAALQAEVRVPVRTSSLLQLPGLLQAGRQVGVLTIDSASLGPEHLLAAGVPPGRLGDVIVQGVDPASEFAQAILGNRDSMDLLLAEASVVQAARTLHASAPELTDLVLECTNMPPYAEAITAATGLRLHSLLSDPVLFG